MDWKSKDFASNEFEVNELNTWFDCNEFDNERQPVPLMKGHCIEIFYGLPLKSIKNRNWDKPTITGWYSIGAGGLRICITAQDGFFMNIGVRT